MKTRYDEAISVVSSQLRQSLERIDSHIKDSVQEIRLRANQPVILCLGNRCAMINSQGAIIEHADQERLMCSYECLQQTFRGVCGYSVHTHQREMVRGYVTLKGGHRAGFGGSAVEQNGVVTALKEVSSINIRVARQVFGTANSIIPYARKGGFLLVGRPGSGKTTVLRDLARQLGGFGPIPGKKVTVLDERGELAAVWDGIPQNDVGINTDVLNGFSKSIAMEMAVRSLSPDVIICDEIGSQKEALAMLDCMNAGVQVIASVHANDINELQRKPWVVALLRAGVFEHIGILDAKQGKGTIERICTTNDWLDQMDGCCTGGNGVDRFGEKDCSDL